MIRQLTRDDGHALHHVLYQLDEETQFMLYEPGERQTSVEDIGGIIERVNGSGVFFGAFKPELVGFISASCGHVKRTKHSAYIVIGILSDWTGQGIGYELMTHVEEWAIKNGVSKLELTVMAHNENALKLYHKCGYLIEGNKKHSIQMNGRYYDEFYMGKVLNV